MTTELNPLEGFASTCCEAEHDTNAEYSIINERITGCCANCGNWAEFFFDEADNKKIS